MKRRTSFYPTLVLAVFSFFTLSSYAQNNTSKFKSDTEHKAPHETSLHNGQQAAEKSRIIILDIVLAITSLDLENCSCESTMDDFYNHDATVEDYDDLESYILSNESFKLVIYDGENYTENNHVFDIFFKVEGNFEGFETIQFNPDCLSSTTPAQDTEISDGVHFEVDSAIDFYDNGGLGLSLFQGYNYGYIVCPAQKRQKPKSGQHLLPSQIYPNPTSDLLFLSPEYPPTSISIFDNSGTSLINLDYTSSKLEKTPLEINISSLPSGIYFLNIRNKKQNGVYKFVKN